MNNCASEERIEDEKPLTSFRDAFSTLISQRKNESSALQLVQSTETKLYENESFSAHWSPTKAVNPRQIFTDRPNSESKILKADSDYFSGSGSPKYDAAIADVQIFDNKNFPKVENIYGNIDSRTFRPASNGFSYPPLITTYTAQPQPVIHQKNLPSFGVNVTNHLHIYTDVPPAINTWNVPSNQYSSFAATDAQRPQNTQVPPYVIARTLPSITPVANQHIVPTSWKYVPNYNMADAGKVIPNASTVIHAPVISSIPLKFHMQFPSKQNASFHSQDPNVTVLQQSKKSTSHTKERVRERAIRNMMTKLIDILPYEVCKSARPLKSTVLQKAAEYILSLKDDIQRLERKLHMSQDIVLQCDHASFKDTAPLRGSFLSNPSLHSKIDIEPKESFLPASDTTGLSVVPLERRLPEYVQTTLLHQHVINVVPQESLLSLSPTSNQENCEVENAADTRARQTNQENGLDLAPANMECFEAEEKILHDKDVDIASLKRPMNSFMLYSKENRQRVVRNNPGLDNRTISRMLGQEWCNLSFEEKFPYRQRFKTQLEILRFAFPDWTYNSYKSRDSPAKRKYNKKRKATEDTSDDNPTKSSRKIKTINMKKNQPRPKITKDVLQKFNEEEKISLQSDNKEPESFAQWSSWLHGGPYFSCSFGNNSSLDQQQQLQL